jgi:hypothetical protein
VTTVEYNPATGTTEPVVDELPPWKFDTLLDWMEQWFFPVAFRFGNERAWCPEWWRHRWVVERLGALWMLWEEQYPDPESRSSWWVYHFDAHWAKLTAQDGPFQDCNGGHSDTTRILPYVDPPAGWVLPALVDTEADGASEAGAA